MKLLEYVNEKITPNPELLEITEFKKIYNRSDCTAILSYIFNLIDYRSPYSIYDEQQRAELVKKDILPKTKLDKDINNAVDKYKQIHVTEAVLLLESARKAIRSLREYFDTVDVVSEEDQGKASKDLIMNIKSMGAVIQGLRDLEEEVSKEKQTEKNIRKNVEINEFNEG
jgi:hypothetical protein